jgi:hypothetical protein
MKVTVQVTEFVHPSSATTVHVWLKLQPFWVGVGAVAVNVTELHVSVTRPDACIAIASIGSTRGLQPKSMAVVGQFEKTGSIMSSVQV